MNDNRKSGMTRRELLRTLGLGTGALALGAVTGQAFGKAPTIIRKDRRPNILFIMSDQERNWLDLPSGLGLNAHEWLLERGTGYTNFNMHTTPCSPARSTIYCGQHTQHTRMTTNVSAPPFPELAEIPTIGHMLREQGYYTAYKGKWHLSDVPVGTTVKYGHFDSARNALEPFGFSDYSNNGIADGAVWQGFKFDGETASEACLWLQEQGRSLDKPWFLAVNFINPHDVVFFDDADRQQAKTRLDRDYLAPLSPPPAEGAYAKYWDLPLPKSYYADSLAGKPWAQTSYVEFCNGLYGRIDPGDETRWRHYQSYYYNCIRDMDSHMMTVLKRLEALGLADNTIVVFTADHGDMLGAHRLRQKGPFMYKENVRVPFIIRHPDAKTGHSTTALGGAIDIVPTLLAFAGMEEGKRQERYPELKGVDISATVADAKARTQRDAKGHLYDYNTMLYVDPEVAGGIFAAHEDASWWSTVKSSIRHGRLLPSLDNNALFRGVNEGRYKFARYFKPSEHHIPKDWETLTAHNQLELYDTQTDPDEIVNLAAKPEQHKDLLMSLNAKTNALIAEEIGVDDGSEHPGPTFRYTL